jgi:hypothetical protein
LRRGSSCLGAEALAKLRFAAAGCEKVFRAKILSSAR